MSARDFPLKYFSHFLPSLKQAFSSIFRFSVLSQSCTKLNDKFTLRYQPRQINFFTCHMKMLCGLLWKAVETGTLVQMGWMGKLFFFLLLSSLSVLQLHLVIYWVQFIIILLVTRMYARRLRHALTQIHSKIINRDKHAEVNCVALGVRHMIRLRFLAAFLYWCLKCQILCFNFVPLNSLHKICLHSSSQETLRTKWAKINHSKLNVHSEGSRFVLINRKHLRSDLLTLRMRAKTTSNLASSSFFHLFSSKANDGIDKHEDSVSTV